MTPAQHKLIGPLLHGVSRSFYLTLRVLPAEIRPQISLAYLLARATDTIADTQAVPRARRIISLRELQSLTRVPDLGALPDNQALPAERVLLERLGECLEMLDGFTVVDRRLIQSLLHTIITGQIFDLEQFPDGQLTALTNDEELDRYTYLVAGCVGEFWTKMCQTHLAGMEALDLDDGVRFGKGLQLVNVLRDIPKDLRMGRCYLPVKEPAELLQPENFPALKPVYDKWLDTACDHLDAGWQYTLRIPAGRSRLACVWPIWIGLMTIARLRHENPLDPARRIKISRGAVYGVMARSLWGLPSRYDRLREQARG